jgi:hypothetical protein
MARAVALTRRAVLLGLSAVGPEDDLDERCNCPVDPPPIHEEDEDTDPVDQPDEAPDDADEEDE